MSFFDEDDDPPRTARTRVRPSPPRRGRVTSGGTSDAQTLLVRRMIAGIVGILVLLLLFFLVRACNNTRRDNALRDYNRQVTAIGTGSQQTGEPVLRRPRQGGPDGAERPLPVDSRPPRLRRSGAQAGQGAERPGRHGSGPAIAADRARAAPGRAAGDLRQHQERARRQGRERGRGAEEHRRPDACVRRLGRPLQRPRPAVHQGRPDQRGPGRDDRALAVPEGDLLGLAQLRGAEARDADLGQHRHRHGSDEEAVDRPRSARHRTQQHDLRQRHAWRPRPPTA